MDCLVSVVTPFYNSADHLEECIRSVLGQTFTEFEYVLVNNCSTDASMAIASRYAGIDSRIRLVSNEQFLGQVQNYNAALRQISPESSYCKIVQADDWIFANCLEEMVNLVKNHPNVGIVSAYRLRGQQVTGVGLPYTSQICSGRDICRAQLLENRFYFGSPTTVLFRSDIVRSRLPFYAEGRLHEDTEACYEILKDWDFGFVHQVLSFTRIDNESIMSNARRHNPEILDRLIVLRRFGPCFLSQDEFAERWDLEEARYLRFLAEAILSGENSQFWAYHQLGQETMSYRPSRLAMARYLFAAVLDIVLNPKASLTYAIQKIRLKISPSARK